MAKYQKKPIIVDAEQWFPGKAVPGVCGDDPTKLCGCCLIGGDQASIPHVHPTRLDYGVKIEPGDWIIAEQDGSGYSPCKPDVFSATYDIADDSLP